MPPDRPLFLFGKNSTWVNDKKPTDIHELVDHIVNPSNLGQSGRRSRAALENIKPGATNELMEIYKSSREEACNKFIEFVSAVLDQEESQARLDTTLKPVVS